ncbi:MAG: hypothetical protein HUJ57_07635 [Erysipelotrichaceae bacterium]|nr:hypothetical protein [Erysipelotrichaceae bacterium]
MKTIIVPAEIKDVLNRFKAHDLEAFVVGGSVRDQLLGKQAHDYDITTNALPQQVKELFRDMDQFDAGIRHGTVTIITNIGPVEITTYRTETTYKDHRHPDEVRFASTLQEDCARRDLTINALCWNETDGLKDYFHGLEDLDAHIIRAILEPKQRFEEDALRIMRTIRFAAELNFTIEEETHKALFTCAGLLKHIAMERIQTEFFRILNSSDPTTYINTYLEVLQVPFPFLKTCDINECPTLYAKLHKLGFTPEHLRHLKCSNEVIDHVKALNETPLNDESQIRLFMATYPYDLEEYAEYHHIPPETFDIKLPIHSLPELAISGKDVADAGYQGPQIKAILQELFELVLNEKLPNEKDVLLKHIQGH